MSIALCISATFWTHFVTCHQAGIHKPKNLTSFTRLFLTRGAWRARLVWIKATFQQMELGVSVDSLVLDEWLCLSVQSGWETTGPCSICAFIFTADCMNVLACNIYTTVLLSSLSIRTTTLSLLLFNTQMFVQQHLPNLLWLLSSSLLANNYTRAHVCIANRVSYGAGGHWDSPLPTEIWKLWCHNYLNSYNRIYNTITKCSIIIGLLCITAESDVSRP